MAKPSSFRPSGEPYAFGLSLFLLFALSCAEEADEEMRPSRPYVPPPTLDGSAARIDAGSGGSIDAAREPSDARPERDGAEPCDDAESCG